MIRSLTNWSRMPSPKVQKPRPHHGISSTALPPFELSHSPRKLQQQQDSDLTEECRNRDSVARPRGDVYSDSFRHSWSSGRMNFIFPFHLSMTSATVSPNPFLDGDVPSGSQSRTPTCNKHRVPLFTRFNYVFPNHPKSMNSASSVMQTSFVL